MRLTVGACCELADRTGLEFDDLTKRANAGRVTELRWLLWAALQPYHREVVRAPEFVGAVIDQAGGIPAIRRVLRDLIALNADDMPEEESGEPAEPDRRPGSVWRRLLLDARPLLASDDAFWQLSLKDLWLLKATIRQQQKAERDRIVTQAWWTSVLVWRGFAGKVGSLDQLLKRPGKPRQQTWQEMKAIMQMVSGAQAAKGT